MIGKIYNIQKGIKQILGGLRRKYMQSYENNSSNQSPFRAGDVTGSVQEQLRPGPRLRTAKAMRSNPLDVLTRLALADHFDYERMSETELQLSLTGRWCAHDMSIIWNTASQQIDLYLVLEGRAPGVSSDNLCRLIALINERLRAGHFEYWATKNMFVYRNSLDLSGGADLNVEQGMSLLALALEAAERSYPAFQYVIWAGKSPEDALDSALLDIASMV